MINIMPQIKSINLNLPTKSWKYCFNEDFKTAHNPSWTSVPLQGTREKKAH